MVFYERASGARMHAAYFRPGGVHQDIPDRLVEDIGKWIEPFLKTLDDLDNLLTHNRLQSSATSISVSSASRKRGPGAFRASWCAVRVLPGTLRKSQPYECYEQMEFDIPIGKNGDCYDRYLIRMEEMRQSTRIIRQCVDRLLGAGEGRAGVGHRRQGRAAQAGGDEAVDGSADPPLQALHRGLSRAGKARSMRQSRRRRASSAVYLVSGTGPTSLTAASCARRALLICRPWIS